LAKDEIYTIRRQTIPHISIKRTLQFQYNTSSFCAIWHRGWSKNAIL